MLTNPEAIGLPPNPPPRRPSLVERARSLVPAPAFQAAKSWVVSQLLTLQAIFAFAIGVELAKGTVHDFHSLFAFVFGAPFWFGVVMAMVGGVGPYHRAAQGHKAAKTFVTEPPDPTPKPATDL